LLRLLIALMVPTIAFAAIAEGAAAAGDRRPVLGVLLTAGDAAREARFVDELRLTLDGFEIAVREHGAEDFAALPLRSKLEWIESAADSRDAVATIWLEIAAADAVLLYVVALSTGRAFIRIVEVADSPGAERELAIAAGELLGQVYLLEPGPVWAPVDAAVDQVLDRAAALRERERRTAVGAAAFFTMGGGLYPADGGWLRLGGGAALEVRPVGGLLVRAGLAVVGGPFEDPDDGTIRGFGLHPEIGLGHLWSLGRLRLGPVATAAMPRSTVTLTLGRGAAHTASWWSFRGAAGLQARIDLGPAVALFLEPVIGIWSNRRAFERVSDASTALLTPLIDGAASLGVCFSF